MGNKINELRAIASIEKPDIICISESWLNFEHRHLKAEFIINGYKLFSTDRNTGRKGGGVILYIKDSITCCIKSDIKSNNLNYLGRSWEG